MLIRDQEEREYFIHQYSMLKPRIRQQDRVYWDSYITCSMKDERAVFHNLQRVENTISFLRCHDVPDQDDCVLDIGCGSGSFLPAFAKASKHLTETDFSSRILAMAEETAHICRFSNVDFRLFDISRDDPERKGWVRQFDLVFSALVPECYDLPAIRKMETMSRKYCFLQMLLLKKDPLATEIFHEAGISEGLWAVDKTEKFQLLDHILCLEGCHPNVTYYRYQGDPIPKTEDEYISILLHSLTGIVLTDADINRLKDLIRKKADAAGRLSSCTEYALGSILWDIRDKKEFYE